MRLLSVPAVLLAGCASAGTVGPHPPPPVDEARKLLDEIIDAGLERDFERLCANASRTCEGELDGREHLVPVEPPVVVDVTVHQPVVDARGGTSGGVEFVLCGTDAAGSPFESEVVVVHDGERLLAGAAVWWVGTHVSLPPAGDTVHVGGEPSAGEGRCP